MNSGHPQPSQDGIKEACVIETDGASADLVRYPKKLILPSGLHHYIILPPFPGPRASIAFGKHPGCPYFIIYSRHHSIRELHHFVTSKCTPDQFQDVSTVSWCRTVTARPICCAAWGIYDACGRWCPGSWALEESYLGCSETTTFLSYLISRCIIELWILWMKKGEWLIWWISGLESGTTSFVAYLTTDTIGCRGFLPTFGGKENDTSTATHWSPNCTQKWRLKPGGSACEKKTTFPEDKSSLLWCCLKHMFCIVLFYD